MTKSSSLSLIPETVVWLYQTLGLKTEKDQQIKTYSMNTKDPVSHSTRITHNFVSRSYPTKPLIYSCTYIFNSNWLTDASLLVLVN